MSIIKSKKEGTSNGRRQRQAEEESRNKLRQRATRSGGKGQKMATSCESMKGRRWQVPAGSNNAATAREQNQEVTVGSNNDRRKKATRGSNEQQ